MSPERIPLEVLFGNPDRVQPQRFLAEHLA